MLKINFGTHKPSFNYKSAVYIAVAFIVAYFGSSTGVSAEPLALSINITAPNTIFCFPAWGQISLNVSWGDGSTSLHTSNSLCPSTTFSAILHSYTAAGVYNVSADAYGAGPVWLEAFGAQLCQTVWTDMGNANLVKVISFGTLGTTSLAAALAAVRGNTPVPPSIPATVTSIDCMFGRATEFNQSAVSFWNTSQVTRMSRVFYFADSFNQPLNSWNVAKVTSINSMFYYATKFDHPLDSWNISSVMDMENVFQNAAKFNRPVSSWDVSKITSMNSVFAGAWEFNQSLSTWDVSRVTNFESMFRDARNFNQPLASWDTRSMTRANYMFNNAFLFDQPIGNWNTSSLRSAYQMFLSATNFNRPLDTWDVSKVEDFTSMFSITSNFNQPLNSWNTRSAITMRSMFNMATAFNQPLDNWNTSNVEDMAYMFTIASVFDQPLNTWDVRKVQTMVSMFQQAISFNGSVGSWNLSRVTDIREMFRGADKFNQPIDAWRMPLVTSFDTFFTSAKAFNQPLNSWNVSNVRYFTSTFSGATAFNQPLNGWDVSSAISMASMFSSASSFNSSLSSWKPIQCTNMAAMFSGAGAFNQPLDDWDVSSVVQMQMMFRSAPRFNSSLSSWRVNRVTDMTSLFEGALAFNQSLLSWCVNSSVVRINFGDPDKMTFPNWNGCLVCPAGTWRSLVPDLSCVDCPGGSYCPYNSTSPTTCEPGSYCPRGIPSPLPCPVGAFCPRNTSIPNLCPSGSFCPANSSVPQGCTAGFFCPANTSAGSPCPEGSFCPSNAEQPTICSAGFYCPALSPAEIRCDVGQVSGVGAVACSNCAADKTSNLNNTNCVCVIGFIEYRGTCFPCPCASTSCIKDGLCRGEVISNYSLAVSSSCWINSPSPFCDSGCNAGGECTFSSTPRPVASAPVAVSSDTSQGSSTTTVILAVVITLVAVAAISIVALLFFLRRRKSGGQHPGAAMDNAEELSERQRAICNIKSSSLKIETKLGEGSYGVVYLAKLNGQNVAVKTVAMHHFRGHLEDFFREASLMMSLPSHPNVVRMIGLSQEGASMSMVMEYIHGGSLETLSRSTKLDQTTIRALLLGVASGMAHLASHRVVHRDLAARNILLAENNQPKIADLGLARVVGDEGVGKTANDVGPIRWMAPESISDLTYSEKSDVWSFGCVAIELIQQREPWAGVGVMDVGVKVRDTRQHPPIPPETPQWLRDVLDCCFKPEPEHRPSFSALVAQLTSGGGGII